MCFRRRGQGPISSTRELQRHRPSSPRRVRHGANSNLCSSWSTCQHDMRHEIRLLKKKNKPRLFIRALQGGGHDAVKQAPASIRLVPCNLIPELITLIMSLEYSEHLVSPILSRETSPIFSLCTFYSDESHRHISCRLTWLDLSLKVAPAGAAAANQSVQFRGCYLPHQMGIFELEAEMLV